MAGVMSQITPVSSSVTSIGSTSEVRVVQLSEYREAAYTIAEAFFEDDVGRYFIDTQDTMHWTEKQKWDLHLSIMEYMTSAHLLKGVVTTIGENYGCVALWMPPNAHMDDTITLFRSGLWRLYYKLTPEGRHRFFTEFFPLLHHTKSSVLGPRDEDSYYLVYIGTRKDARGQGYGRKLFNHMIEKADAQGRAMYLESSNAANLGFYGRLGFEVKKGIALKRGEKEVLLDVMVREPIIVASETKVTENKTGNKAKAFVNQTKAKFDPKAQITSKGNEKAKARGKDNTTHAFVDSKSLLA